VNKSLKYKINIKLLYKYFFVVSNIFTKNEKFVIFERLLRDDSLNKKSIFQTKNDFNRFFAS